MLDVSAAYPTGESTLNASGTTTVMEPVKIEGVTEAVQRSVGLNLSAGTINATEIMVGVCKAPTFSQLLKDLEEHELTI
jgi:hypothetical protein